MLLFLSKRFENIVLIGLLKIKKTFLLEHLTNMYVNEIHTHIDIEVSNEILLFITACDVYFFLVHLRRNLLDMDTFSKSDPGK